MNILFFGTPAIAVPFLEWLSDHEQVVGVVCRPDEPVGRGHNLTPPPTKVFAAKKNIPVFQPEGPWTSATIAALKSLGADVGIAVAYGRIMPKDVYGAPRLGTLNVHFSLLPHYRGAAPMQWALINGEKETGVTTFWLEEGMDTGPIFHQDRVSIEPSDDAASLKEKLVRTGLNTLANTVHDIEHQKVKRIPQAGSSTLAPAIKKEMGRLDWNKPASEIVNVVRGLVEWPGVSARVTTGGEAKQLKILKAAAAPLKGKAEPGEIVEASKEIGIAVATKNGQLVLKEVQPEGKKAMPAWAFWQGARLKVGDKLG